MCNANLVVIHFSWKMQSYVRVGHASRTQFGWVMSHALVLVTLIASTTSLLSSLIL